MAIYFAIRGIHSTVTNAQMRSGCSRLGQLKHVYEDSSTENEDSSVEKEDSSLEN